MSLRLIVIATVFGASAAGSQTPADFWRAVTPRLIAVRDLRHEQDSLVGYVASQLHHIDPDLTCELGTAKDGVYELIVSADGLSRLIPTVKAVVQSAPVIKNWRVIAFRPRLGTGFTVRYDGFALPADSIWFHPVREGTGV